MNGSEVQRYVAVPLSFFAQYTEADAQQIVDAWTAWFGDDANSGIRSDWNGDGTEQNPGLKAEMETALGQVSGAVEDAETVKTEWQGADGNGGMKAVIVEKINAAAAQGDAAEAQGDVAEAQGNAAEAQGNEAELRLRAVQLPSANNVNTGSRGWIALGQPYSVYEI